MRYLVFALTLFALPAIAAGQPFHVEPVEWDFGDVPVGETATSTFVMTGDAVGAYVDVLEIRRDPAGAFALESFDPLPILLDHGSGECIVAFAPPHVGSFSAHLAIAGSDPAGWDVPLTGRSSGVIPEPGSLVIWSLLGFAAAGCGWRRRRSVSNTVGGRRLAAGFGGCPGVNFPDLLTRRSGAARIRKLGPRFTKSAFQKPPHDPRE